MSDIERLLEPSPGWNQMSWRERYDDEVRRHSQSLNAGIEALKSFADEIGRLKAEIAALTDGERIRREAFEEAAQLANNTIHPYTLADEHRKGFYTACGHLRDALRSLSTPSKGVG